MNVINLEIDGVKLIEPKYFEDYRGYYSEVYSLRNFVENGINNNFIQDNHSYSAKKGTLRGIHFQNNPKSQAKLIRCTSGVVLDVVVDLRKGSPTYLKWFMVELSKENRKQLLIPHGCGHAFLTLTDDCEVLYKVDEFYDTSLDRAISWNDDSIGINWPINDPIISKKDIDAPTLKNSDVNFVYEEKNNNE